MEQGEKRKTRIVHTPLGPAILIDDAIAHVRQTVQDLEDREHPYYYENGRRNAVRNIIQNFRYIKEKAQRGERS